MVFLEVMLILEDKVAERTSIAPRMEFELAIFLEVMTIGTGSPLVEEVKIECAETDGRAKRTWEIPVIATAN
jgi:hypothetical protein